ncbi:TldD/PmbA family protein [Geitlerinema sp. PCC 7407]|uniref:TldD/PmbA family protein n=1 Tax=Geitlerinema sp. PCC 7407 TaxID=1173025 RepID=UPI00029FB344|nr:TldD/PmbA family protein [Geitlerinema sp. PCC 7407]AFY66046.1 hypothetical protein GEI7407_1555 [Geitlerinema sp. PCC 7407]
MTVTKHSQDSQAAVAQWEASFEALVGAIAPQSADEHISLQLSAEQSQFVRFNHAKVRQAGTVTDGKLHLSLVKNQRSITCEIPLTGDREQDLAEAQGAIAQLRAEVDQLPPDPYAVVPSGSDTSHDVHAGHLLAPEAAADRILAAVAELDFAGLYAGGAVVRAYADSAGQKHWFVTDSYTLDYSLFAPDGQAVKGTIAGSQWDEAAYATQIAEAKTQLQRLAQPPKAIAPGQYRTYLAPAAVGDLIDILSWGGVSEASMRQGGSALGLMRQEGKRLSPQFCLTEDFSSGLVPRFTPWGDVAPIALPIVAHGELVNLLINRRTAKEYGLTANGAGAHEGLRSPQVHPGSLSRDAILSELGTGLYLSNLHYLNWSDRPAGRITGMTRYACFWVEDGEIVAPIENLRFDESLYRFWGENLIALTDFQEFIPNVGTYDSRRLGGNLVPGMVIKDFTYTL